MFLQPLFLLFGVIARQEGDGCAQFDTLSYECAPYVTAFSSFLHLNNHHHSSESSYAAIVPRNPFLPQF